MPTNDEWWPSTIMRIKTNVLLGGPEPTMSLEEALTLKRGADAVGDSAENVVANFAWIDQELLGKIHTLYGPGGVLRLTLLALSHESNSFDHFFELIANDLAFSAASEKWQDLESDNDRFHQGDDLTSFNSNLLMPSLSRKLYNPGTHPGYLVYGLGGPKILVSLPFRGSRGELYDVYRNSIDVVTSLMMRGYMNCRFLFLDNLIGLNFKLKQVPAWILWFSIIATHSDLVVFIKVGEEGISQSQRREIEFTPDRVQKKLVEIPNEELRWATEHEDPHLEHLYVVGQSSSTNRADFSKAEAEHAEPLIRQYASEGIPHDRLIRVDESEHVTEYPLDYPMY